MTYISVVYCGEYEDFQSFNIYVGKSLKKANEVIRKCNFGDLTYTDINKGGYIEVWSKGKQIDSIDIKL